MENMVVFMEFPTWFLLEFKHEGEDEKFSRSKVQRIVQ